MQKCYRDQNRKHGGRGLSCGGWDERFGAAIGHGYGTGGAVSNERNDGVGDIRFCRDAVSGKWAVQQTYHNENKALNHGQSHNALKREIFSTHPPPLFLIPRKSNFAPAKSTSERRIRNILKEILVRNVDSEPLFRGIESELNQYSNRTALSSVSFYF
jgi:hypothetical protein